MRAGDLRRRVQIGRYVQEQDQYGDLVTAWQTVATVWAAIEALSGQLYFAAQQLATKSDYRVRIRWLDGLQPGMIIKEGSREFTIQAVLDKEGLCRELELVCQQTEPA